VPEVTEPGFAKVNLFLRVLGRREDGYHDIETLVLPLTLADFLTVETRRDDLGIVVTLTGPEAGEVPAGKNNLAFRTAEAIREATGRPDGVWISIDKRIPVAAGLGGGSADAAAVLRALGRVWSVPSGDVTRIAEVVGSDVPSLVLREPVLARDRGESVTPIDVPRLNWALLPRPFGVSSADAYRWWDEDGAHTGPDPGPVTEAARDGNVDALSSLLFNDLERPVAARHPEVIESTRILLEAGAVGTILCGSGPTVAGLCRDEAHAREVAAATSGTLVGTISRPRPDRLR
jgi:4-diphosphocytidyl-2-C-methyl-D-erythritol kinase